MAGNQGNRVLSATYHRYGRRRHRSLVMGGKAGEGPLHQGGCIRHPVAVALHGTRTRPLHGDGQKAGIPSLGSEGEIVARLKDEARLQAVTPWQHSQQLVGTLLEDGLLTSLPPVPFRQIMLLGRGKLNTL